jgi:hypothetical protein
MTITTTPQPDGTAILDWDGQVVAVMRSRSDEWEGITAEGWELLTTGGVHLVSQSPQALIDELTARIQVKLGLVPPLESHHCPPGTKPVVVLEVVPE